MAKEFEYSTIMQDCDEFILENIAMHCGKDAFILFCVSKMFNLNKNHVFLDHIKIENHKNNIKWKLFGKVHRFDGPAIRDHYAKYWYTNGKLHRTDGPAIVWKHGTKEWWYHGKLHRTDGPAIEGIGLREWWIDGKKHRKDGPAIIIGELRKWYIKGVRHRTNGPAIIHPSGKKEWLLQGKRYSKFGYYKCKYKKGNAKF